MKDWKGLVLKWRTFKVWRVKMEIMEDWGWKSH